MKHIPVVGEKLYTYTPCNSYYVNAVRNPYTVESVKGNVMVIRAARPVFHGPRYYDTMPDTIVDDPDGKRKTFRWSEKKQRWQESPNRGYPEVAVFGQWDFFPYLD
jgi:hypothetical protein